MSHVKNLSKALIALILVPASNAFALVDCSKAANEATSKDKATCSTFVNIINTDKELRIFNADAQPIIWDEYIDEQSIMKNNSQNMSADQKVISRDVLFFPKQENINAVLDDICQNILGEDFHYVEGSAQSVKFTYPTVDEKGNIVSTRKKGKPIVYKGYQWNNYKLSKDTDQFASVPFLNIFTNAPILQNFSCR